MVTQQRDCGSQAAGLFSSAARGLKGLRNPSEGFPTPCGTTRADISIKPERPVWLVLSALGEQTPYFRCRPIAWPRLKKCAHGERQVRIMMHERITFLHQHTQTADPAQLPDGLPSVGIGRNGW
jgi:hypothetical protein